MPIETPSATRGSNGARRLFVPLLLTSVLALPAQYASAATGSDTGFAKPFAGVTRYEQYAPTELVRLRQLNRPLGRPAAHRIARGLGLDRSKVFTPRQYRLFITGRGVGGERAPTKLVDASVRILTNTTGRPLRSTSGGEVTRTVLSSYGLMVNRSGMLQSPANAAAPTRQVNSVIEPGGYMAQWCRANGARAALRNLYRSAYRPELKYGTRAQDISGAAQLVTNDRDGRQEIVGMSMAPALWVVNFALIYTLNPRVAAKMPARWAPIPGEVADAIAASATGQVPFDEYRSSFPRRTYSRGVG